MTQDVSAPTGVVPTSSPSGRAHGSLRSFLADLEDRGDLLRVPDRTDPEHVLGAVLAELDPGPAVFFEDVGHPGFRAVGNVLGTLDRIALALGVPRAGVQELFLEAARTRGRTVLVQDAPVSQRVQALDFARLPVPTFFEQEGGPYVTAGVVVAKDPVTGDGNASYARVRPLSATTAMVGIAPNHHLNRMAHRAPDGRLEIAVVLGAPPAVALAACLYLDLGDDELLHCETLLGEPLRVTRAATVDLLVPADAELVLEGVLDVGRTFVEGTVSEYHGMYEDYGAAATATFGVVTSRADPVFPVVLPGWHAEHALLGAVPIAAGLRRALAATHPNVRDVAVTTAGGGRVAVVVSLHEPRAGQAQRAMFTCWSAVSLVKQVTVVDSDVDVWDAEEVEWARLTRCRAERDLVVVPGALTDRSEPLSDGGTVAKVGFDATARAADRTTGFTRAVPPAAAQATARGLVAAARAGGAR